jgi:hypothetical protein
MQNVINDVEDAVSCILIHNFIFTNAEELSFSRESGKGVDGR